MSSEWRDKDRTKDAPWSEYVWDSRGCWVTSRRNEEGEWGHEYSYPETVATPSQDPTQALSEDHQPGSTTSNSYRTADENVPVTRSTANCEPQTGFEGSGKGSQFQTGRSTYSWSSAPSVTNDTATTAYFPTENSGGQDGHNKTSGDYGPEDLGFGSLNISVPNTYQEPHAAARGFGKTINTRSEDVEKLDIRHYTFVRDGRRFFRVGRVFKTLWSEPRGNSSFNSSSISVIWTEPVSKIRRFVVIRERKGYCICLPLMTYQGQGLKKYGIIPEDHAVVYSHKGEPLITPGEETPKKPIPIILEQEGEKLDPMTRLNFAKVYTIEHNINVAKVGRVPPENIHQLLSDFDATFNNVQPFTYADTSHSEKVY